jgi:hypothetical protein
VAERTPALFLHGRWGSRGPLSAQTHLLELARIVSVVTALLLPALLAGRTTSEVEALSVLTQSGFGSKNPWAAWTLGLFLLGVAYRASRLKGSVKEENLPAPSLVARSVLVFLRLPKIGYLLPVN